MQEIFVLVLLLATHNILGATGRNGGHLWPAVKTPENQVGKEELDDFRKVYTFDLQTMDMMEEYLSKHNISHSSIDFRYTVRAQTILSHEKGAVIAARYDTEVEILKTLLADAEKYYKDISTQYNQSYEFWDAEKCM